MIDEKRLWQAAQHRLYRGAASHGVLNALPPSFQTSSPQTSLWTPAVRSSCVISEWADSSSTPWPTPLWARALTCLWVEISVILTPRTCPAHAHHMPISLRVIPISFMAAQSIFLTFGECLFTSLSLFHSFLVWCSRSVCRGLTTLSSLTFGAWVSPLWKWPLAVSRFPRQMLRNWNRFLDSQWRGNRPSPSRPQSHGHQGDLACVRLFLKM